MKGLQSKCCDQTLGLLRDDNHPRGSSGTRYFESKQLIQLSIQIEKAMIITGHVISEQIINNLDVVDDALRCRKSSSNSVNCTHLMELSTPSAFCEESSSMYGHTYSKSMDQPGKVANPARGQLNRENEYSPVRVRA